MQTRPNRSYGGPSALTPVVQALLIANGVVFLLLQVIPQPLYQYLALWPLPAQPNAPTLFAPWQLATYGFMHGGVGHIFFNMFALYMFGTALERLWGSRPFLLYYMVCVVGAAVSHLIVTKYAGGGGPTVGASGGVFGILLGYGMMYPNRIVMLIFPPIPMQAKYFVVLYGLLELWLGVTRQQSSVAHFAHLGGMLFGVLMILYWRGRLPFKPRRQLNR